MATVRKSTGDSTSSEPEAPGTSQPSVRYVQTGGTMNYNGVGASSGEVKNQQNIAVYDTGMISTGDTISLEAAGTFQQSINKISGPVYFIGDNNTIGGFANKRNEENKGAEASSYSMFMKSYYSTTLCKTSPLPWYPEYTWDIDEVYTELALKKLKTSKFGVEELFEQWHKHNPKGGTYRILIEGDAGYGKSTLMLKIASDWSNSNDYTSRFSLLFVVKLGSVGEDGNLLSYMDSIYEEKMRKKVKDVLESKGAEVLVLLDGYDEANAKTKREADRIMTKETMSNCHVVVTSRFGHVPDDVKRTALLVTVKGFGQGQVAVAVGKFFIKAGHLTKADVIRCIDKSVPPSIDDFINVQEKDTGKEARNCIDKPVPPRTGFYVWDIIAWVRRKLVKPVLPRKWVSDNKLDDSILPGINDFKNVQENDPLLPADQRLNLKQFNEFMGKLRAESPYKELARCPLLCVMMCCLVSDCPNGKLPSTVPGLYFAMINRNLYRADRKKPRPAGEVEEQWDWDELDSRIVESHENCLQEFGRLCVEGLKTGRMSFTLFDITGQKRAKTTDVKVTRLIEAGVLVQDTNERNPRYQVPHRTSAEFLAAYCLETDSSETEQKFGQQTLLDLYRLKASFDGVAASLIEMGKTRCLADAFRGIKFPVDCLTHFMKSYFFEYGAAGTWMEFKDALPNKLQIKNKSETVTVSSAEPNQTLLHLCEVLCKGNTRETNARPSDCLVSIHVRGDDFNPNLLQTLSKSGVRLERLDFRSDSYFRRSGEESRHTVREVARILQELLKSHSCPVQLSFHYETKDVVLALTEAMRGVPEGCRLKSFDFLNWHDSDDDDLSLLLEVLAEKWLSHLKFLGLNCRNPEPILKRLREPGCSLTSLHLSSYILHFEDLMMLASKLETLSLEGVSLNFHVTEISKYAPLKSLCLKAPVYLSLLIGTIHRWH